MKKKSFDLFSADRYYTPGPKGLIGLMLWFLLGVVLGSIATMIMTAVAGAEFASTTGMVISYPLMFIPAMIFVSYRSKTAAFFTEGVDLDARRFGKMGGWLCAALAVVATIGASFMTDAINSRMPEMPAVLEEALKSLTQGDFFINLLCVSVLAPICEEWLCRGMILRGLLYYKSGSAAGTAEDGAASGLASGAIGDGTDADAAARTGAAGGRHGLSPVWAIIISALVFALIHGNPWQAIPAFVLGCLFGYIYYKTGSLRLTMLMHCANNTLALVCGQIPALQEMEFWTDVLGPRMYGILFAAFALLLILIIRAFSRIPKAS